jgi:hypothetical protein
VKEVLASSILVGRLKLSTHLRLTPAGTDIQLDQEVAIKLTNVRNGRDMLKREAEIYNALAGGIRVPHIQWFGDKCDFYVLVEDLLSPSLRRLRICLTTVTGNSR